MRKIILLFSFLLIILQPGFSQFIDTDGDMCIQVRYLAADYHYDEFITNDDILGDPEEHTIRLSARVDEDINNLGWQGDTLIAYEGDDEVSQNYLVEFGGYLALNNDFVGDVPTKVDLQYFYWEDDCFDCKECTGFLCTGGCATCGGGPSDRFVYSENCPNCFCIADPLNICNDDDYGYLVTFEDVNIRDFPPGCTNRGWFDGDNSTATDKPRVEVEICWTPPRPDFLTLSADNVCTGQMVNLLTTGAEWNGNYRWEYRNTTTSNVWTAFGDFTAAQAFLALETTDIRVFTENGGEYSKSSRDITLTVKTESEAPISISASSTATCPGNPVTLTTIGGTAGTGATLEWFSEFCGGFPAGSGSTIDVSPSETTTYYVRYEDDCTTETACASITIDVTPIPPPVANSISMCEGETATLEAFGFNGTAGPFNWYDSSNTPTSATIGPFTTGTYVFSVEEVNMGCLSPRAYVTVSVSEKPAAPLASPVEVCNGQNAVLIATAQGSGTLKFYDSNNTQVSSNVGLLQVGTYTYSVTEFNGVCESDPTLIPVTVVPGASPPVADDIIACEGETITLTAIALGGGSLIWFDATGTVASEDQTGLPIGIHQFSVIEDNTACVGTPSYVAVSVSAIPPVPATNPIAVCEGENVILSATAAGSGSLVYYDSNGTQISSTVGLLANGSYSYQVAESNGNCESARITIMVTVDEAPSAPLASNIEVCEGEPIILSATTSTAGGVLTWYDNADVIVPEDQTGLSPGNYTYCVEETNGGCSSVKICMNVTVLEAPNMPMMTDVNICEGSTATLNAGAGIFNWYEDVTMPAIASGSTFTTPVLSADMTYFVEEIIGNCASPFAEVNVIVASELLVPNISSNSPLCEGSTITLNTDLNPNYTYAWSGPNLFSSMDQNPQILNSNANLHSGSYQLIVTDNISGCTASNTIVVEVSPTPQSLPLASNSPVCEGEDIILSTAAVGGAAYSWSFDDGSGSVLIPVTDDAISELVIPAATAANIGTYTMTVTIEGCSSASTSVQLDVLAQPANPTASNSSPACAGDDVILSTTAMPNTTYSWVKDGIEVGTSSVISLANVTAAQAGDYTLVAISNGCDSPSAITTVVITDLPIITDGSITNNGPLCEGETLTIDAPTIANVSYSWTSADGIVRTTEDIEITDVSEADHQGLYTLVVTDNEGCESEAMSTYVQIDATPSGISAGNSGATCIGGTVSLTATGINNATYAWSGPNGYASVEQNPELENVTADDSGIYTVSIILGDCVSTELQTFVSVNDGSSVSAGLDLEILQGEIGELQGSGAISYTWSPADYLNNTGIANPMVIGAPVGTYTYTVTGYDVNLCSSTDEVTVNVLANDNLDIMDLITPNGDGVNDTWTITYLENLKNYTLKIYARAGVQILETNNYNNDWDGTYEGENLPDGTYWYVIKSADGTTYKGAVTVKR